MVDEWRFRVLFSHLGKLRTLSLASCKLGFITSEMLASLSQLSVLSLRDNAISSIPDGCFDSLENLTDLDLSGNKISVIGEDTFSLALHGRLAVLNLGQNPFVCTCDLLWFSRWFAKRHAYFVGDNLEDDLDRDYRCENYGSRLITFTRTDQACMLSREASILITFSTSLFVLTLTVASLVFRFRWHIRLLLYEVFRGRDDVRKQRLATGNFDYDVFVSYASEDLPWVRQHLMPELESCLGLKLCVHERDFIPGHNIVDNIADCVNSSKKIVMLFSRYFLRSQWCQFELAFCLSHVMDYDDALIVVCLDDVASRDMTSAMMAVLKTTTYIQWAEQEDAVRSFWGRVRQALHEVLNLREHGV